MKDNASKTSLEKPLLGAVICCTSIAPEDRTRLAEYAEQMGAEHKLDLTSDVTHLLVGSTDTPKYQYVAREREDVKVLRPEWVEAVRECWMEDRSLDMNALEAEFRVPTLAGLKICITGFEDLNFRSQLQKNVVANGGEYTGDLTKDVTHLIAAKPDGKKYEYAMLWQKKVVSLQWYKDTLQRGMQLDESSYHPSRPTQEQGVGAWNKQNPNEPKVGKRTRGDQPLQEPVRKLRRTASAMLGSQTENMWGDIVGQAPQPSIAAQNALRSSKSVPDIGERKQLPAEERRHDQADTVKTSDGGFLNNSYFAISRFENRKAALVLRTLQAAGANIIATTAEFAGQDEIDPANMYLIVPHQTRIEQMSDLGNLAKSPTVVTELWLERCMLQRALIPPHKYPLGGIIAKINSPEIESFTVNATGFQSIETLHIAKTVALTGARYTEVFTPKASVLVCNSMNINKQKLSHAKEWSVPVVSEGWLCKFLIEGLIPSFGDYLIKDGEEDSNDLEAQLRQKRLERNPRRPEDDEGDGEGQGAGKGPSMSTHARSQQSATSTGEKSSGKQQNQSQMSEKRDQSRGRHQQYGDNMKESTALQEISPNSPSRRDRPITSPLKKSLFKSYDGASSTTDQKAKQPQPQAPEERSRSPSSHKLVQDTASINSAIEDLLNMKAKVRANELARQAEPKDKKRRLFGRALSNLSNASHGSRQSRASSVDSLNTDGLGSEIAPPSGKSVTNNESNFAAARKPSLQGRAQSKLPPVGLSDSLYNSAPIDPSDPHLLRDELEAAEEGPQLTQLGYEDSEEAIAMREKLAEKRRARGRLGQNDGDPKPEISGKEREMLKQRQKQKQVIKDDETLNATGWGGGGRTRAKNRSSDFDAKMF